MLADPVWRLHIEVRGVIICKSESNIMTYVNALDLCIRSGHIFYRLNAIQLTISL